MAVPEEDIRVVCTDGFVFIKKLCGLCELIDKAKAFESLAECDIFCLLHGGSHQDDGQQVAVLVSREHKLALA